MITRAAGTSTFTNVLDYASPLINQGIKDPILLYSYYTGYQAAQETPQDTADEKQIKEVKRAKFLAKGVVKGAKMVTKALGVATGMAVPFAVAGLALAGADAYLMYRDWQKA